MKKFSLFILSLLFCTGYMSGADWNVYVARYKQDKACAISYTFDDGLAEHYTLVAPQLEKRGFRGTFWICGSNINKDNRNITDTTRMTWPQLKEMSDKGHEISNHGWAHKNFARFPIEEIKEDILKNDSAIFANTGVMPRTFCYPNNNKKAEGRRIAVQNRVGTRTHQRSIGSKSTLQDLEKWMNTLIETNDWGVGMTHGLTYGYDAFRNPQRLWDHWDQVKVRENEIWIGTFSGTRSEGYAFVGDITGGLGLCLHDFWQSYPSSIEISGAKTSSATITAWLWSPEGEPMDLRHYDNVAHDLNASYEDVQDGMSTPYGIARTTTLTLIPQGGYVGKKAFADTAKSLSELGILLPTPDYLHAQQAFGVWSLPDRSTSFRSRVEDRLDAYINFYSTAIEQNKWYGFWNYGDVMHAYDPVRHTWRYDIGGFAWDNTELASNMWLWYNFLRTGREDIWRMAEAMTRHTAEVDAYHIGPNAGLGSRHNVSHWGCGAKEARISQAAWNRFYYYLTTDDRCGDLMTEVKDADQKLYELDPMRLAQPRSEYPCTAPARLRIGPDWLAYAGNWMTEWERTGNTAYRDKIVTGMKSIATLPNRIFTGPKALGFDPSTGIITTECDSKLESSNHLMTIMGGFEVMNEMIRMIDLPEWKDAWLDHAARYKQKAWELNHSRFRISRLMAYAAYHKRDAMMAREAWDDLFTRLEHTPAPPFQITTLFPPEVPAPLDECVSISTNDAALWSLDAIYMQEVIPMDDSSVLYMEN